jgi:hypothetical protein
MQFGAAAHTSQNNPQRKHFWQGRIRALCIKVRISSNLRDCDFSQQVKRNTRLTPSFAHWARNYLGISESAELILGVTLLALLAVVKIISAVHQHFDSDESQHLHVVWSWTCGLVQYRDIFDNHMPLFHIMFAPIAALIGERATILYAMRFLMVPLYFVAAWATYEIGKSLFSPRVGFWSSIVLGLFPSYHFNSLEFRPDNLWATLWLLLLVVLLRGPISLHRALTAGLLLGLCFGLSMKSSLFLISLLISGALAVVLVGYNKVGLAVTDFARYATLFLATALLIPITIMVFFALRGAWDDFFYCVFGHQFLSHLYTSSQLVFAIISIAVSPFVVIVARQVNLASAQPEIGVRRVFIVLLTVSYFLALKTFWPLIARSDYLPFYPLAFVLGTASLLALQERTKDSGWSFVRVFSRLPLPGLVALAGLFLLVRTPDLYADEASKDTAMVKYVLELTTPADFVLDAKGETVFRKRCFRPVLEIITRKRIARGLLPDNAPQRCVETATCLAATTMVSRFSTKTLEFIESAYLPVSNHLRVAGSVLRNSQRNPERHDFEVVIPADYEIITRDGVASGILDGSPCRGPRFLEPGRHSFESSSTSEPMVCLWVRAVERDFTPFSLHFHTDD